MNKDYALIVDNVHKSFRLPHEQHSSLKQTVLNWRKRSYEKLNVLEDISFKVKKGEFFGIVGRNGSGKSTLLKTIAGIYQPDSGGIMVNGKLTPFIELGIGFNPELTGRDNVFLNGAILGLSRQEITSKYEEIVEFAGLERFMDQKLKNYSSGMQLRLAFSVAIQAQNEILLLDEVLAVGDENFQNKCVEYFTRIKKSAEKTVILVTHDMGWVERFCDRALVIHEGRVLEGVQKPHEVHMSYSQINQKVENSDEKSDSKQENSNRWGSGEVKIKQIKILNEKAKPKRVLSTGESVTIDLELVSRAGVKKQESLLVGLGFYDETGTYILGPNSKGEQINTGKKTVSYKVSGLPLNTGRYYLSVGLFNSDGTKTYDFIDRAEEFKVVNKNADNNRGKVVVTNGEWSY